MSIVNTNFTSVFVANQINSLERALSESIQKISSGTKLLDSSDDPSGVISQSAFTAHVRGARQAMYNVEEIYALMETADSAASEMEDGLMEMRDAALEAANDATLTAADFTALDNEFQAGVVALAAKVSGAEFNGNLIFDAAGPYSAGKTALVGPFNGDTLTITIPSLTATVATFAGEDLTSAANATSALTVIDNALDYISLVRSGLGTYMQGLEIVSDDLSGQDLAISSALSNVEDVDYASEIANFSDLSTMTEAATSILATIHNVDELVINALREMN